MRVNTPEGTKKALDNVISRLLKLGRMDDAKTIHDIKDKIYPKMSEEQIENTATSEVKENEPEPEKNV